jgi:long-chain fatty acid transport protein
MEAFVKRFTFYLVLVVAAVLIATAAVSAGGFQINEHGSRAMAQGGAFVARAYDPSAMFFNPAGLAFQNGAKLYLGTTLIAPKASFFGPYELSPDKESKMVDQMFTPINVYATYQVMDRVTVGVGVNNPYGLGSEWEKDWDPYGRTLSEKVDLMSFFFTPTVGVKVTDELAVGVGFNYVTGTVAIKRVQGLPVPLTPTPPLRADLELDATGMSFNGGLLFKANEMISVGASYRSATKLDASGTASFDKTIPGVALPAGDVTSEITLPATAFVGVAVKPMSDLELEFDYQFTGWSSYKELKFLFKVDNTEKIYPKNYEDVYTLRFGGQYSMGDFDVRFGYLYDVSPVKTEFVEPMLPSANASGISCGLGYKISSNLSIDASYLFMKYSKRDVHTSDPTINFNGTYTMSAHLIGIDVAYNF